MFDLNGLIEIFLIKELIVFFINVEILESVNCKECIFKICWLGELSFGWKFGVKKLYIEGVIGMYSWFRCCCCLLCKNICG